MKPLRLKIQDEVTVKKAPMHVIEKDYALSYVLAGIALHPKLAHSLIFKGGTALKKIFFGDYRFSEDLDFSVIDAPMGTDLENCLNEAAQLSKQLLNNYGPFDIQLKRYPERAPHPKGQDAFNVLVKFPWHSESSSCRIKLEITHDEPVILSPEYKPVLHDYDEHIDCWSLDKLQQIINILLNLCSNYFLSSTCCNAFDFPSLTFQRLTFAPIVRYLT